MTIENNTIAAAQTYIRNGYRPVPIPSGSKGPRLPNWPLFTCLEVNAPQHFSGRGNIGIILGDGLVCVDLDHPLASQFAAQYLPPSGCVIGRPGNPRSHWFYRVDGPMVNKPFRYKTGGKWCSVIDILSDGKQVVVGPSVHPSGDTYEDLVGEPATVTADDLMAAIQAFFAAIMGAIMDSGEIVDNVPGGKPMVAIAAPRDNWGLRPGDDYNGRADIRSLLIRHGWTQIKEGENEHWRRPGKGEGNSATLRSSKEFYNFSPNSPGLMPDKCYSPFGLFAALEHGGDFRAATVALLAEGYGGSITGAPVDLSGILRGPCSVLAKQAPDGIHGRGEEKPKPVATVAPDEPFPVECLCPPGLIGDIIRHNLRTASNPQPILALSGALALMSVILGNKVRSFPNHHTYGNLFILALAPSAGGKDHARKLNRDILDEAEVGHLRGAEGIGSAQGIPAALHRQSVILMQIDEIADLLVQIKDAPKSPHLTSISPELKKIKTSAGSVYMGNALVHEENLRILKDPYLVLYGTATNTGFWGAITTPQVTDGLLGRFMIFEANGYAYIQDEVSPDDVPIDILDRVKWWGNLVPPDGGNLRKKPILIEHTTEAKERAISHAKAVNKKQIAEHENNQELRAALWGRTAENTNQLALLFACSRALAGGLPTIELGDVDLAIRFSNWLTRNMVRKIAVHVGENDWERTLKKMLRAIPDEGISQYGLRRQFRMLKGRELPDALAQLVEGGDVAVHLVPGGGRTATWFYRPDSGYMVPGQRTDGEGR